MQTPYAVDAARGCRSFDEEIFGNRDFGHLERDVAAVAHDFRADLDQLLLQNSQAGQWEPYFPDLGTARLRGVATF
jgi:hypothetical protein